jgi:pyrrolidone-carboxylate peptidase
MNERLRALANQAGFQYIKDEGIGWAGNYNASLPKFAQLIVRECLDKIETHRIPAGNSAAGEMACEWTYSALIEIRDEIREHFGVEP